jgi:hypothetical protein
VPCLEAEFGIATRGRGLSTLSVVTHSSDTGEIGVLTGREIRFRKTCTIEQAAQIELGKLLAQAAAGRQPDST